MRTTYHSETYVDQRDTLRARSNIWTVPVARFFFSLIFIVSGFNHFTSGSISYADAQGIPLPDILVPVSGIIAIVGGISVLLGLHARVGATLLLIFLVPVTLLMHDFWNVTDPQMAANQMAHFMKNLSLIGGALLIVFYGSGPISIDHHRSKYLPRT